MNEAITILRMTFFWRVIIGIKDNNEDCLLYTSDAADEEDSVDLGGRRLIKKKKREMKETNG